MSPERLAGAQPAHRLSPQPPAVTLPARSQGIPPGISTSIPESFPMRNLLLATLGIATAAAAQCGTLTIAGSGAPGTNLTVTVHGAPTSIGIVVVGNTAGTTSIPLGAVTLDLGVE